MNTELQSTSILTDDDQFKKPISDLRRDIEKRKVNKLAKHPKPKQGTWAEIYPAVANINGMLQEYATVGIIANNNIQHVPEELVSNLKNTIKILFEDVTVFSDKLLIIKTDIKAADTVVTPNDIAELFDIYEKLDGLRLDITTVLSPNAFTITETLNALTKPEEIVNAA